MKVLVYGECADYGSGAWCYLQTLEQMGIKVDWFHPYEGVTQYLSSFFWKGIRKLNGREILKAHLTKHNQLLLQKAKIFEPDIIVILKGLFVEANTIEELKSRGSWVVNINHDDFFSLNPNNRSKVQWRAIPSYDHLFTTREVNVEELLPYNKQVSFFPFAFFPDIHKVIDLSEEASEMWRSDVLFIGTWERERAKLLEQIVKIFPAHYAIYGSQWDKVASDSPLKLYIKNKELRGHEMAHAIRYSCMSLGFLRKENRDDYTQRSFEIPACGGLLLAERTLSHQKLYKENEEAVFFEAGNASELCKRIQWLLEDAKTRESIRLAGCARLQAGNHTYKDRIDYLIKMYDQRRG